MCVAQLDRALGYGPRCRGFESSHARLLQEESRTDCPAFFLQRTYGSDSNGFGLRSASVGAKRRSTGPSAPSHARYIVRKAGQIVLLFSYNEPTVRIRTGSVYAPFRSVLNEDPPDLQRPLTHVILQEKQDRLSCFFLATNL